MNEKQSNVKIYFECQRCRAKYSVSIDHAGKLGTCKICGSKVTIPRPQLDYSKQDSAKNTFGASKINDSYYIFQKKPIFWGSTIGLILGILGFIIIIAWGLLVSQSS